MSLFNSITFTGIRHNPGEYINGIWVEGSTTPLTFTGSLQPLSPNQIALLPEGRREDENYKIITNTELKKANVKDKTNSDIIFIDNKEYEVFSVKIWRNGIIPHYNVTILILEPGTINEE